jgi:hypothetical protein
MDLHTCVVPEGYFIFSIHKPAFTIKNLRKNDYITSLGRTKGGEAVFNQQNFPKENIVENKADWIYEIPNPFPFRGTTYISKAWADRTAKMPASIILAEPNSTSLTKTLEKWLHLQKVKGDPTDRINTLFTGMPRSVLLALAATSTDPQDLIRLAHISTQFIFESDGITPKGILFQKDPDNIPAPVIKDIKLFEAIANNPHLPDLYKKVMVLNPGIQGSSEIVGEWAETEESHVFEYLRRNSYIPWGHYAANMAHDSIRYCAKDLKPEDICGMRQLYYQRTYVRMAEQVKISLPFCARSASIKELETLRKKVVSALKRHKNWNQLNFNRTLWGWNFGFDFAASGYRLHASHQQAHQQFAMLPASVPIAFQTNENHMEKKIPAYACGDLIEDFIQRYRKRYRVSFFTAYERAIRSNRRMDGAAKGPHELVLYEDSQCMLFVPKAQTSQWEVQLMPKKPIGNIIEADSALRASLDQAIWVAMRTLGNMGAKMITVIEFSKKIAFDTSDQRLLYSFLPRLPESPGAFSEAQLRWINGHYPEDFAAVCRSNLPY